MSEMHRRRQRHRKKTVWREWRAFASTTPTRWPISFICLIRRRCDRTDAIRRKDEDRRMTATEMTIATVFSAITHGSTMFNLLRTKPTSATFLRILRSLLRHHRLPTRLPSRRRSGRIKHHRSGRFKHRRSGRFKPRRSARFNRKWISPTRDNNIRTSSPETTI